MNFGMAFGMKNLPDGLNLIGIHGHAGAGKDTVATYIREQFVDVYVEHFADPIKVAASHAFNITLEDFYLPEKKEIVHPVWKVSPRQILQFMGTEMFREKLGELLGFEQAQEFWIRRMHGRISGDILSDRDGIYSSGDTLIIPDVRFQNEYDWIMANGGLVIRVIRADHEGLVGIKGHASEAGIHVNGHSERNYFIDNSGTLEDLYAQVDAFIDWTGWKLCPAKFDVSEF